MRSKLIRVIIVATASYCCKYDTVLLNTDQVKHNKAKEREMKRSNAQSKLSEYQFLMTVQ